MELEAPIFLLLFECSSVGHLQIVVILDHAVFIFRVDIGDREVVSHESGFIFHGGNLGHERLEVGGRSNSLGHVGICRVKGDLDIDIIYLFGVLHLCKTRRGHNSWLSINFEVIII